MNRVPLAILLSTSATVFLAGCAHPAAQENRPGATSQASATGSFAYPVGDSGTVTQKKDKDEWYNALDFGEHDHLGEDWNKNTGGNTDCGETVYAAANGTVTYAGDAGPGWGNVLIIEHQLPNGERVQTLYGHLKEIIKTQGEVKKREQIGKVGNANGRYLCHLHLELRSADCRDWGRPGGGYSSDRTGWFDPSDYIDRNR